MSLLDRYCVWVVQGLGHDLQPLRQPVYWTGHVDSGMLRWTIDPFGAASFTSQSGAHEAVDDACREIASSMFPRWVEAGRLRVTKIDMGTLP